MAYFFNNVFHLIIINPLYNLDFRSVLCCFTNFNNFIQIFIFIQKLYFLSITSWLAYKGIA